MQRNTYPQYYYRLQEEEEDLKAAKERLQNEEYDATGEKPCVGLCYYYKKLEAAKQQEPTEVL